MSESELGNDDFEKNRSASNLEALIPDVSGEQEAESAAAGNEQISSEAIAAIAVNGLAEVAEGAYKVLKYPAELREKAVSKLTPVLEKYNVRSEFLDRWKAEIECAVFFGGVIFTSYLQVQEYKKQQEKEVKPVNDETVAGVVHPAGTDLGSTYKYENQ